MVTVYFQSIALKYRISNNLSARYEKFLGLANQTMRRKPSMIYFCVRLSSNASRKGLTSCMSRPGQTALRRNLLRDNQKRCREVLHRTDRKRGCVSGDHSFAPPSMAKANTITIFSSTLWRFEGLRLAFRQTLRNCSWRRRKQGMPGHRDSLRKAFRGVEILPTPYTDNIEAKSSVPSFAKRFWGRFCCRTGRFSHSVSKNYFTANYSIIIFITIFVEDRNH